MLIYNFRYQIHKLSAIWLPQYILAIPFSEEFSAVEVVYGIVGIAVVVKFLERQKINIVMRRGRKWLQRRLPYKKRESSFQKHVEPPLVMPEHSLKIGDSAILNRFELSHNQGITLYVAYDTKS